MTLVPRHPTRSTGGDIVARDSDADLVRASMDTSVLIVLLTDPELEAAGLEDIVERGLRYGIAVIRRPIIAHRSVPGWLMTEVASWRLRGAPLYADATGKDGAAIAAAWALVGRGTAADEAIAAVRAVRGSRALRSSADQRRVREFEEYHRLESEPASLLSPIPTMGLRRAHLPPPRAPWFGHLNEFALTFDGYAVAGNGVHELFERQLTTFRTGGALSADMTIDLARACLFSAQRAFRINAQEYTPGINPGPSTDVLKFLWELVEWLRAHVSRS